MQLFRFWLLNGYWIAAGHNEVVLKKLILKFLASFYSNLQLFSNFVLFHLFSKFESLGAIESFLRLAVMLLDRFHRNQMALKNVDILFLSSVCQISLLLFLANKALSMLALGLVGIFFWIKFGLPGKPLKSF